MKRDLKKTAVPKLRFPEFREAGEWEEKTLGEIGKFTGGGTPSKENESYWKGDIPWISSSDIFEDSIHKYSISRFISEEALKDSAAKITPKNSILLVSRVGVGKLAISRQPVSTSQDFTNFTPVDDDLVFIAYYLKTHSDKLLQFSQGMAIKGFTKEDISKLNLSIPSPAEQQKLATFLTTLDTLLAAETEKLRALQAHKKGLMQVLFPGEGELAPRVRFGEFEGEWELRRLGKFISERSQFPTEKLPLYSLTIENGITPKTERYERSFLVNDEAEAYKVVCPGDFAFNPMNLRFGAIARHSGKNVVAVSKYYNIFHCDDSVDSRFCELYFTSYGMITHYNNVAIGTLIEKRRVHFSDFLKFKIHFPKLKEQQKIAATLTALDALLAAQSEKIAALKRQKTGLMQRLLRAR